MKNSGRSRIINSLLASSAVALAAAMVQVPIVLAGEEGPLERVDVALMSERASLQDAQSSQGTEEKGEEQKDVDEELEQIVVTGSRIRRTGFDTMQPATVVTRDLIEHRAFTNIADALNELPAFGPADNTAFGGQTNFAIGANFVDFFGLGSQRTLTLIDGARFVSSNPPSIFSEAGGLQVDFNVIPIALVERIETIATGGAPIYGSDAIAGTINVILRHDFEGFEVSFQHNVTQKGDPQIYRAQAVYGSNFGDGRGNVAISLEYNRENGLLRSARPRIYGAQAFFQEVPDVEDVDGDGTLDDVFQIFFDRRVNILTQYGTVSPIPFFIPNFGLGQFPGASTFYAFDADGNLVPFDPGTPLPNNAIFSAGGDGFDLDEAAQIRSPTERLVGTMLAHYDVTDWLRASVQVNFANTEATELRSQGGFNTFVFSDDSDALVFSVDHPLLSDQARQTLLDVGATSFWVNRIHQDLTNNGASSAESFIWRAVAKLEAGFSFLGRDWTADFTANFGQSDIETRGVAINDARFLNALDAIRLTSGDLQALVDDGFFSSVEDAQKAIIELSGTKSANPGDVICRSVLQAVRGEVTPVSGSGITDGELPFVEGCIPLNIFGQANPDAVEWVQAPTFSSSDINQRVYTFNVSGDLFDLPGGPFAIALGYENRREKGAFVADEFLQIGLGRSAPILPTGGVYSTDEFYGEGLIPLVSPDMKLGSKLFGFPVIQYLELQGAARIVDNSLAGSDTTWSAGGRLGITEDFTLRGNFTRAIRSPSIQELFSPRTTIFSFANDPCDFRFIDEGPAPANRRANCEAAGITQPFTSTIVNATGQGISGGNPNLSNEKANSWTIGAVITPRWIPGLEMKVDFIQIDIRDRITSLSLTQILEACFDAAPGEFPNEFCSKFQRDAGGQIVTFETGFENAASSLFKGIDWETEYQFEVADLAGLFSKAWGDRDLGTVRLNNRVFRRIKNQFSVIGEEPNKVVGGFAEPKWSGTFDMTWTKGPATFFWRVIYQDSALLDPQGDNFFQDLDGNIVKKTSARIINNASVSYTFFDMLTAQFSVNNVMNRKPSVLQRAAGDFGVSEILGRQFIFRVRVSY